MNTRFDSPAVGPDIVPTVPAWAMPRGAVESDVDAAYMAGSALNSLDRLVRSDAVWLGALRHRLALKGAAAVVRLMGRRETESDLRDAWLLRAPGDDPGPAGNVLAAWRRLAGRSSVLEAASLAGVAQLLGLGASIDIDALVELVEEAPAGPAPLVAARIADAVVRVDPRAEPLAWWLADLALARRMRWAFPVPVLVTQLHSPLLRLDRDEFRPNRPEFTNANDSKEIGRDAGGRPLRTFPHPALDPDRARARPGGEGFGRACLIAAAAGAAEACKAAAGIAVRARRLEEVAPRLRAKGAGEVVRFLLEDDAVPGTLTTRSLSRWGSRRLFDRLLQLDAVRELSGRDSFRIFGL